MTWEREPEVALTVTVKFSPDCEEAVEPPPQAERKRASSKIRTAKECEA